MPNTLLTSDGKSSTSATAGSSTGSYLIPRTLFNVLVMAVRNNQVFRALAAKVIGPSSIPGSSIDIPLQTKSSMVINRISEGGEAPLDVEQYSGFNIKPYKYGVRIGVTDEMMEDSLFDIISMNLETAAYEIAQNEEALIISTLDTASGQTDSTQVTGGATISVSNITDGMKGVEEESYTCTHMIVGTEVAADLRNIDTFVEADKAGISDPSKRLIGKIFEMKVIVSNNVAAKYAYIVDRSHAFIIVDKRPVRVERYKDTGRGVEYAVVTQRFGTRYLRSGAVARITTT